MRNRKGYTYAYDPDGEYHLCPECGENVMNDTIHDRQICNQCTHVITEEEFRDMLSDWDIRTGGDGNFFG